VDGKAKKKLEAKKARSIEFAVVKFVHTCIKTDSVGKYSLEAGFFSTFFTIPMFPPSLSS
jgi:hypothetical protein